MTAPFKPSLLVPVYNHGEVVRSTLARLAAFGIPIYVVDDGSDEATREELHRVAGDYPQVRLFRLPRNSGKGAAVMHGMREARAAGLTHALQIDADGQHCAEDVPKFLSRGEANPDAVICGRPVFDATAPRARLYGRYLTYFWVWVETLSFAIGDPMCGFRLYPLVPTCALIDAKRIPTRMDFDIDIIVRLAWLGLRIENVSTRVTYPEGGRSHFDMLRDNLRISRTHTLLVCRMLAMLPGLLSRRLRGTHSP